MAQYRPRPTGQPVLDEALRKAFDYIYDLAGRTTTLATSVAAVTRVPVAAGGSGGGGTPTAPLAGLAPDVTTFQAGQSTIAGDGSVTFAPNMYWDSGHQVMRFDWGCLAPDVRGNWSGLQIWIKKPDGLGGYLYVKMTETLGIDQFSDTEGDGRLSLFGFTPIEVKDVPVAPETWTIIAASLNIQGALNVAGYPLGPSVDLTTLSKEDYVTGFTAVVSKRASEPGEELWGINSDWVNPAIPRYSAIRIMLLDYGVAGNVQQLSGDNSPSDPAWGNKSRDGYWPWPATPQNVKVVAQSMFGDDTVADLASCPYVALTIGRTLGGAGQEYTSQVTGFGVTVTYPEQADGSYKASISIAFTKPSVATWGALSIQFSTDGGTTWKERARGSVTPVVFEIPVGIVATTFKVGGFGVDVNGRVNTWKSGTTPTVDIIVGNAAGQFDATKFKVTTYDTAIFKYTDGKFTVLAIDGSLVVTGSINSSKLNATSINVGGGGSKPGEIAVYNAAGTQVAHIGVEGGYDSWFQSVGIGGTKAVPKITAKDGAVTIDGATLTLNLNGITTEITNAIGPGGYYVGLGIKSNSLGRNFTQLFHAAEYYDGSTPAKLLARFGAYLGYGSLELRDSSGTIRVQMDGYDADTASLLINNQKVIGKRLTAVGNPTVSIPTSGSVVADAVTGNLYNYLVELQAKLQDLRDRIKDHGLIAA